MSDKSDAEAVVGCGIILGCAGMMVLLATGMLAVVIWLWRAALGW